MDSLAVLIALVVGAVILVTPILALWATVAVRRERRERAALEGRLQWVEWHLEQLRPREHGESGPESTTPRAAAVPGPPPSTEPLAPVLPQAEAAPPPTADMRVPEPPAPIALSVEAPVDVPIEMPSPVEDAAPPRPPQVSWEERLATRVPIWLGAIALVLAGAFLVKFSIDRGLIGPPVRVALGLGFGVVLLGLGEWLRQRDDRIAQACSAAGVAVLFVVVWAATALWGLLAPVAGFAFLALVTAVGVALSLRQGVIVAVVGLIGGLLAPALAGAGPDRPAVLFGYLLVLCVAILAVSGRRGWTALSATALLGTVLWTLSWLGDVVGTERALATPVVAGFLVLLALAFLVLPSARPRLALGEGPGLLGGAALFLSLLVAAFTTGVGQQGTFEWVAFGLLAAATLVLARLTPRFLVLPWLALVVVLGALLARLVRAGINTGTLLGSSPGSSHPPGGLDPGISHAGLVDPGLLATAIAFAVLFPLGGYLAHRGAARPIPMLALVSVSAVLLTLLVLAAGYHLGYGLPDGVIMLGVGALLVVAAIQTAQQRREGVVWATGGLGALAAGASACAALAIPLELERAWISVGWALEVFALVWLAGRLELPLLRRLGLLVAAGVGLRLLLNPMVLDDYPTGEHPLLSWLLYGYGIPTIATIAAARSARVAGARRSDDALTALALGLMAAWWFLSVRQFYHPGDLDANQWYFAEWGALASGWLGLALVWHAGTGAWIAGGRHRIGARLLGAAGLAVAVVGPVLVANPSWSGKPVSLGLLVLGYLIPAALLLGLAGREARGEHRHFMAVWGSGALILVWVGITQLVRFGFRGASLTGPTSGGEGFAVSASWIGLGIALLVVGVRIRSRPARYAALAVMGVAAAKVFLVDMGELEDLWRVASFLGLGASLLVLAGVYRKFVLARGDNE